jgi:hypothetical protein
MGITCQVQVHHPADCFDFWFSGFLLWKLVLPRSLFWSLDRSACKVAMCPQCGASLFLHEPVHFPAAHLESDKKMGTLRFKSKAPPKAPSTTRPGVDEVTNKSQARMYGFGIYSIY